LRDSGTKNEPRCATALYIVQGDNVDRTTRIRHSLDNRMPNDPHTLKAGAKAPNFSVMDDEGKRVSLADYKGRPVVLYFYPKDDTPG
jgi:cytochrome oxidase Cu insertion factor (SCO1/SenC/PrrC family)